MTFTNSDLSKIGIRYREDGAPYFLDYSGTDDEWFEYDYPSYLDKNSKVFRDAVRQRTTTRRSVLRAMVTRRTNKARREQERS